jgi:hypothetical protein
MRLQTDVGRWVLTPGGRRSGALEGRCGWSCVPRHGCWAEGYDCSPSFAGGYHARTREIQGRDYRENLVTSWKPDDIPAFNCEMVKLFGRRPAIR